MAKTYMKLDGNLVPVSLDAVSTTAKEEQTKTVTSPDFSSGNVVVTPDVGKVLTQVTVVKDNDLVPENIVKDVDIFGVVGTAETGTTGGYKVTFQFYGASELGADITIIQADGKEFVMYGVGPIKFGWGNKVVFENVTYIKCVGLPYDYYNHIYRGITEAEMLAGKTLTNDIKLSLHDD